MNAHSHVNTTDKTDTFLNDITEELGEPERCAVVLERAAKRLKVELVPVDARITQEVDSAVARLSKRSVDAVLVSTVMILATRAEQIVQAIRKARLPAIYPWKPYLDYGGLMYYGMNHVEAWRRAASYVDRILKGTKPNDLPFEEISRFDLVINLREANALGLERFARSLKPTGRELPDLCPDDST